MNTRLMFSSATDLCSTPQDFFDSLNAEFHFKIDVCATPENAKCAKFYTKEQDGLIAALALRASALYMDESALWSHHRAMDKKGLGDFSDGRYGCVPASGSHRHGMVARLLHEGGDQIHSRSSQVWWPQELRPIPQRHCYF